MQNEVLGGSGHALISVVYIFIQLDKTELCMSLEYGTDSYEFL